MAHDKTHLPGITIRSVAAILFAMLLMAAMLVFGETIDGTGWFFGMHILAIPAIVGFLILAALAAGAHGLLRIRLLSRAEMACALFCLLTAAPVMGLGFWTNFIWLSSTIPSQGDFEKLDAVNDKLWPHGPNLLDGAFAPDSHVLAASPEGIEWRESTGDDGKQAVLSALINNGPGSASWIRVRVPLEKDGKAILTTGERYLLCILGRGSDMGPDSALYCRAYYDGHPAFDVEAFTEPRPMSKTTALHPTGFVRYGVYGLEFASSIQEYVDIEFRLVGEGALELADPKLMCVSAFEQIFTGRQLVPEQEYRALRPSEQAAYVMQPDSLWSWAGFQSIVCGHIPIQQWRQPACAWLGFILLLLLATFAVALIMRRQWVMNERYPLPISRIPAALLGLDYDGAGALPGIWKNRMMWLGFGVCFAWCLLRAWHEYNPNVPNLGIGVKLKPYFDSPSWGGMWNSVEFSISAIILSVAIFMELNILMSLVIGFFLYRSLFWLGEATGWNIASAGKYGIGSYPYGAEQMISAYLTYAVLTLFFTRKYLWGTLKSVCTAQPNAGDYESRPPRMAFLLLLLAFVGAGLWGGWVGVKPQAMLVLFGAMVLIGFVAMKLRAECGTPFGWFTPGTILLIPLLGGMAFFGAQGTMFSSWTSLGMAMLFIIPGLQLEFIEIARRAHVHPRHVFYTVALGITGGMLIGGWFFLSSMYGVGANNSGFDYWFTARPWEFFPYVEYQQAADMALNASSGLAAEGAVAAKSGGINPSTWGYIGAAIATAAITLLRQAFPGFWLHPIAVVLGATGDGLGMMMYWSFNLWGSLLAAWAIRLTVLKIGGAQAVRTKLFPFFIGVFIAAVVAQALFFGLNTYLYFFDITITRQDLLF